MPRTINRNDRTIEEAVSYAVAHRIRVELLAALNERPYSPKELARIVRQPLSTVTHHIDELLKSGSIEVARTERVRNVNVNFYRSIELPFYSDEEIDAMSEEERQVTIAPALQAIMAEAMAAFWAGKMVDDPRLWISWRWFNVDAQGRQDIADEQARSWERVQEIEAESADRRANSDEDPQSVIVASLGFIRTRSTPHPPAAFGNPQA
jgi:DNA-binding transcriptional ArsR family regulator